MNRRLLAWIGLAYMAILISLHFYSLYTGRFISGIAALLFCPAAAGFFVWSLRVYRAGAHGRAVPLLAAAVCAAAFALGLWLGIPALLQNF